MRRDLLLQCSRLPFEHGDDTLIVAYSAPAEMGALHVLGYPLPHHWLDLYVETSAAINGLDLEGLEKKRPSLLEACSLFGITHPMTKAHKDRMRDLILGNTDYTEEQWQQIADYNRSDVDLTVALLDRQAPTIDVPAALVRARYQRAVTAMELAGVPVDIDYIGRLREHWHGLRMHYINKWDTDFHVYDRTTGSFVERRFFELIEARQWTWPRLASGRYDLSGKTLGKQAKLHSELRPLQQLRTLIAELRLGAFLNTIGADGASRMPIMPFWTKTGRNQPQARDKAFLLSLPSWVHGVIRPPPGYAVVALDWVSQEPGIIAGLCSDPHLRADFLSGDAHMRFAIRAGLAPEHATKATHGEIRSAVKPISLGTNYGLSKHGVAASTGKPLVWAQMMLERHRAAYPVFVQWQRNLVASARFDQIIHSPLGWPMRVTAETGTRTLLNYPAQAGGSDCLRVACIAAHEAGIELIAPLHDALWFTCPIDEVEATITLASDLMMRAAEAVCGIRIPVEVGALVRWPQTLGNTWDPGAKGHAMWAEVRLLVERDELQEVKQHA